MKSGKLVIFDLDGTLFRTETVDVEAFNKALEELGGRKRSSEEILGLIGVTLNTICAILLETSDREVLDRFRKLVISYESTEIERSGELYPGTQDFLKRLRDKGFRLCICSNGNEEYVKAIAEKFGFYEIFDEIWFEKEGISKDEAVGILKNKFKEDKFIMVGDRENDIRAGRKNGGITIGAAYGFGKTEINDADYIADDIPELEKRIYGILSQHYRLS